jgi:hypothetical protein
LTETTPFRPNPTTHVLDVLWHEQHDERKSFVVEEVIEKNME